MAEVRQTRIVLTFDIAHFGQAPVDEIRAITTGALSKDVHLGDLVVFDWVHAKGTISLTHPAAVLAPPQWRPLVRSYLC